MEQYIDIIKKIINEGVEKKDRTGTGTISIFGHQSVYDLSKGFPLLTAKSTYTKGVIFELLWFLGNHMKDERYKILPMTNIKYLVDNNVNIWNEWPHKAMNKYQQEATEKIRQENPDTYFAEPLPISLKEFTRKIRTEEGYAEKWGDLGPVYGSQWCKWKIASPAPAIQAALYGKDSLYINQIKEAINTLKTNPDDRGIIVSAWNVAELKQMALRPCHAFFQLYTQPLSHNERYDYYEKNVVQKRGGIDTDDVKTEEKLDKFGIPKYKLSLQLYQRSADVFLGVPFNIASYSLLTHMIAQVTNMVPDKFVHTFGDAHIYLNHKTQVNELLKRVSDFDESFDFWTRKDMLKHNNLSNWPALPKLSLNKEIKEIQDFTDEDIMIENYKPFSKIDAPVAI